MTRIKLKMTAFEATINNNYIVSVLNLCKLVGGRLLLLFIFSLTFLGSTPLMFLVNFFCPPQHPLMIYPSNHGKIPWLPSLPISLFNLKTSAKMAGIV